MAAWLSNNKNKMKEPTEDQQKCIDLIKSGTVKNLKLAFELNRSQKLGVDTIYSDLYKKWEKLNLMFDGEKELIECFPILSTKNTSLLQYEYTEDSFKNGLDGVCEILNDVIKYFYFPTEEEKKVRIKLKVELEINDYKTRYYAQLKVSQATGIDPSRILIIETSGF